MLNRTGLVSRAALGAALGLNLVSCATAPKPPAGDSSAAAPADAKPVADTPAAVEETAAFPAPVSGPSDFSLTIYSSADPANFSPQDLLQQAATNIGAAGEATPGYGVVRETRHIKLDAGNNRLEFADVAAGIDPTTVTFQSLTAPKSTSVLEQNFEFDLASPEKLLRKYIGRDVIMTLKAGSAAAGAITGRLMSVSGDAYVVQTGDPKSPIVIQRIDNVDSVRLAQLKTGFVTRPTLNWNVNTDKAGEHQVQVTYQTDGLTWRADYNIVLSADEKSADLSAWVTALNLSGLSYPDAKLKLVAGDVHRLEAQRQRAWGNSGGSPAAAETGFREKGFFSYHLYTLGRSTSLPNNSTKQIELFSPKSGVPISKNYVYNGVSEEVRTAIFSEPKVGQAFGVGTKSSVDIYAEFQNGQAQNLGIPLPAGRMRMYKIDPADGSREFIGEDVVAHTPKDEDVLLRLGSAFDIVGERRQTDFKEGDKSLVESFEIKLRDHKAEPVHVIVNETLYRWSNWEITQSSDKWERKDYRTIRIPVDVPANGEKVITYSVKYSW